MTRKEYIKELKYYLVEIGELSGPPTKFYDAVMGWLSPASLLGIPSTNLSVTVADMALENLDAHIALYTLLEDFKSDKNDIRIVINLTERFIENKQKELS